MSQTDTIKVTDTIVQTAQFIWQRNGFCTSYLLEYYIVGLVTSNSIFKVKSHLRTFNVNNNHGHHSRSIGFETCMF